MKSNDSIARSSLRGVATMSLAVASITAMAAPPACVPARQVVERFLPADCADCWQQPEAKAPAASTWVLDWIVPMGDAGAALSAAALLEAAERRQVAAPKADGPGTLRVERALPAKSPLSLRVAGGPAWNGYLGLELRTRGKPPVGATAYLALVEEIDAGDEGSPAARRLVRAVAGPLAPDPTGRTSTQLRALRIPDGAKAERLRGMAWWVDGEGHIGGIVRETCPVSR
jgi:hypothetical protein